MLKHPSFSHGGETPKARKMGIPNQKRKRKERKGEEKTEFKNKKEKTICTCG